MNEVNYPRLLGRAEAEIRELRRTLQKYEDELVRIFEKEGYASLATILPRERIAAVRAKWSK